MAFLEWRRRGSITEEAGRKGTQTSERRHRLNPRPGRALVGGGGRSCLVRRAELHVLLVQGRANKSDVAPPTQLIEFSTRDPKTFRDSVWSLGF